MTYTLATLEVSEETYNEIAAKLLKADYGHVFITQGNDLPMLDMTHIGLIKEEAKCSTKSK